MANFVAVSKIIFISLLVRIMHSRAAPPTRRTGCLQ